jgi:hypothetical protein
MASLGRVLLYHACQSVASKSVRLAEATRPAAVEFAKRRYLVAWRRGAAVKKLAKERPARKPRLGCRSASGSYD